MTLTMTIMQSVPGGGKSHYVKRLRRVRVCSADAYPGLYRDGKFYPESLGFAHAFCFHQAVGALIHGDSVVIDNTNLTIPEVAPYVLLGAAFGAKVTILRIECPQLVAYRRQTHGVPLKAHRRMARAFKEFKPLPYWDVTIKTVKAA